MNYTTNNITPYQPLTKKLNTSFYTQSYFRNQNKSKSQTSSFYCSSLQEQRRSTPSTPPPMPQYATIGRRMPPQAAKFPAIAVTLSTIPFSTTTMTTYVVYGLIGVWGYGISVGLKDFQWQWVGDLVVHCVWAKMEIRMVTLEFDDIQDLWFI